MTYIVAEPCIGVKDHACVDVCPVECFYEGPDMLYIHPEECIDCGACIPECPVAAIFEESDTPEQWKSYIAKNAEPFKDGNALPKAPTREKWEEARKDPSSDAAKYYQAYPKKE
jgi:ferredoxin